MENSTITLFNPFVTPVTIQPASAAVIGNKAEFDFLPVAIALASTVIGTFLTLSSWNRYVFEFLGRPWRHVRQRWSAVVYLLTGPQMIQKAFEASNGKPFEIFAPDNRMVFVTSLEQIKEIDKAPDTVFSLQAASRQMLQPKYSMHGFNWFDRRGTEGIGFVRALRTLLTNYLPRILPDLRQTLQLRMEQQIAKNADKDGGVGIYHLVVNLVVLANSFSFFGVELSKNEEFMKAALAFVEETLAIAEVIRLMPRFLYPLVGSLLANRINSHGALYKSLVEVAEQRTYERDNNIKVVHNDCIQWIMECAPKDKPWNAQRIVYELMAIWFGSVHAMSTTACFAIQDLCLHPEYIDPIRREIASDAYAGHFIGTARGLPLLDSFIKESQRLTPVEALSVRRQATQPFTFADGTHVAVGDWACTPVAALMQSAKHYPSPLSFNGFRFVNPDLLKEEPASVKQVFQDKPSEITDSNMEHFHLWGIGRMVCPGRYYATAVMKIIVAEIVSKYDMELVDPQKKRSWQWRTSMLPKGSTKVILTSRAEAETS